MFIWKISNTRELEQLGREKREKPLNPEAIESTASVPWWQPQPAWLGWLPSLHPCTPQHPGIWYLHCAHSQCATVTRKEEVTSPDNERMKTCNHSSCEWTWGGFLAKRGSILAHNSNITTEKFFLEMSSFGRVFFLKIRLEWRKPLLSTFPSKAKLLALQAPILNLLLLP